MLACGALILALTVALVATLAAPPRPRLLWNASASAPVGLYAIEPADHVRAGDMVAAWTPGPARILAARRHYLPSNLPLVKRIAAVEGDRICADHLSVWINGRVAARRLAVDRRGRMLPHWSGCRTLSAGDYLLLMDRPDSFDGLYFGPTREEDLVGRAVPLWVR